MTVESATSAYESIRTQALVGLEHEKLDPREDERAVWQLVTGIVADYQSQAHSGNAPALRDTGEMIRRVVRSISGYGALSQLLEDPTVEEIFIEGPNVTYIDGSGRLQVLTMPTTAQENRQTINRLLADTDRHIDTANPIVQARVLDDTARLTAVIRPIADHVSATIRKYTMRKETLAHLVELGSLSPAAAGFLWAVAQTGASVLVSGQPGAGKTSVLSALMAAAPPTHCVRCIEEVRELHVPLSPHSSYYEARAPGLDGSGEVSVRTLVKAVLAMRADRIVVGEVRGAEAFELTRASNAGCGFSCTVHANSAREALNAIVNTALMAGENVTEPVVRKVFANTIDFVVHLDRDPITRGRDGIRRQILEILAVAPSLTGDDFTTDHIFRREVLGAPLRWTGLLPPSATVDLIDRVLAGSGHTLHSICEGRTTPL
jgi:pilus assembly protein CpaF